ncbi:hypothetical protein [Streptomyces sp. WMMB303]|uniref:hypothetical protein n=1 Tax=Streptomyces sp. WMMB303 TaxID=3034154 RepID=UPI0023EB3C00|nr:hypothetical protein [Streptomyces sp. WMMB303]MDF4250092.1 hypothetical protein [Streptomyces sp. WMMB303]
MNAVEKAREAAQKAAQALADAEQAEAEKAAQKAAEHAAAQRELDIVLLAEWEAADAALSDTGARKAADLVYEGKDPLHALAQFHVARAKRNVLREATRAAYRRVHGEEPDARFAMELAIRDMRLVGQLESAILGAADRGAAEFGDELTAKYVVPRGE